MDGTEGQWVNPSQQHLEQTTAADRSDAGSIVLGWLTKLVVAGAIFGVVGFDGISVGVAHLTTVDDAGNAVQAASQNFQTTHNLNMAYAAAKATINPREELGTTDFTIDPDGTTHLTLTNTVHTLLLYRTSQTKGLAVVKVHATGKYTGS
jgi:hypothetical protein